MPRRLERISTRSLQRHLFAENSGGRTEQAPLPLEPAACLQRMGQLLHGDGTSSPDSRSSWTRASQTSSNAITDGTPHLHDRANPPAGTITAERVRRCDTVTYSVAVSA